jgi:hypothetical protein
MISVSHKSTTVPRNIRDLRHTQAKAASTVDAGIYGALIDVMFTSGHYDKVKKKKNRLLVLEKQSYWFGR